MSSWYVVSICFVFIGLIPLALNIFRKQHPYPEDLNFATMFYFVMAVCVAIVGFFVGSSEKQCGIDLFVEKSVLAEEVTQKSPFELDQCIQQLGELKILGKHNSVEFVNESETGSVKVMSWSDDFEIQTTIPPQKGVRVVRWFQQDEKVPKVYVNHNLVKHEFDFNGCTMTFGVTPGAQ